MKIAINTLSENPFTPSGSLDFFVQLSLELAKADGQNEYYIFASRANRHLFAEAGKYCVIVTAGVSNEWRFARIITEQTLVPYLLWKLDIDIFFTSSGGGALPLFPLRKTQIVSAIYGTHHLKEDLNVGFIRKWYRSFMTWASMWKASVIIVNSESCKRDVVNYAHLPEDKVRLIYHGISMDKFHPGVLSGEEQAMLRTYGVTSRFILFVSVIWHYKNAHALIEAFGKLVQNDKIPDDVVTVLIGNFDRRSGVEADSNYREFLEGIAKRYHVSDRIKYLGFIPNEKIRAFYKAALVYVQPSFYETFGKTVVEAMACGCPIIGANTSSTPEIVGDAGLFFNPTNPDELVWQIMKVLSEEDLRKKLSMRSLERAKLYSLENETANFTALFKQLGASGTYRPQ